MAARKKSTGRTESTEARLVVEHAFAIAEALGIESVIVHPEARDIPLVEKHRGDCKVLWLTAGTADFPISENEKNILLRVPEVSLSRGSQIHLGMFLAIVNSHLGHDETILCLSGGAGSARLDSILITNPRRDFPWFRQIQAETQHATLGTHEFARLVEIALRLSTEGREGKPVGTIFVVGDMEQLTPHLKQIVLNPCSGHPRKSRNIHDDEFVETIREFAAMDGAFVVDVRGVVESAGTYLDASARNVRLAMGLGARHAAAAAITAVTDAVSIVVSESSGTVTVFHDGQAVLTLERS